MSDIGLNFSLSDVFLYGLILALPLTTILLAVLALERLRRRGSLGRRWLRRASNIGIAIIAPLWVVGAGLLAWIEINGFIEHARDAARRFALAAERTIDGIALPAGAAVVLNGYDRLESVSLPAGATVAVDGVAWAGRIGFAPAYDSGAGARARIRTGTPAADATLDGVPCRAGHGVELWDSGGLWSCTLAADLPVRTGIADDGPLRLVCAAGRRLELQPAGQREIARCTLVQPVEMQGIPCAAGAEIEIYSARLIGCTLATARRFAGVELPPGSVLRLTDTPQRVEQFTLPALPALPAPLRAFAMDLPSDAKAVLCRDKWAVDQIFVPDDAYVEIGGVKLTGVVNFDCGLFNYGTLFEDARIGGETWAAGRSVFRRDLDPVSRSHGARRASAASAGGQTRNGPSADRSKPVLV